MNMKQNSFLLAFIHLSLTYSFNRYESGSVLASGDTAEDRRAALVEPLFYWQTDRKQII